MILTSSISKNYNFLCWLPNMVEVLSVCEICYRFEELVFCKSLNLHDRWEISIQCAERGRIWIMSYVDRARHRRLTQYVFGWLRRKQLASSWGLLLVCYFVVRAVWNLVCSRFRTIVHRSYRPCVTYWRYACRPYDFYLFSHVVISICWQFTTRLNIFLRRVCCVRRHNVHFSVDTDLDVYRIYALWRSLPHASSIRLDVVLLRLYRYDGVIINTMVNEHD